MFAGYFICGRRIASALLLSTLFLVSACGGRPPVLSTKDIPQGHSLVIAAAYEEAIADQKLHWLWVEFRKFDPFEPKWLFEWRGKPKEQNAENALPGRYHFYMFGNGSVDYLFEPHNARYEIEVREGEAVYIGDIVELHRGNSFRIAVRDNEKAARQYFEENFADSGLTFRKRLMRRVRRSDPILPR